MYGNNKKNLEFCSLCNNWRGSVEEKYNGKVPVYCACTLKEEKNKYGHWRSPCMICPSGDKLWWVPISDHIEDDGRWWHTPYFAGPAFNIKK